MRPEDLDAYVERRLASEPPDVAEWCTVADLARAAGCSRARACRLLERGVVPFAVFAGIRYIKRGDLECVLREIAK